MKQWMQKGLAIFALVAFMASGVWAASFYSDQITNSDITVPAVKNSPNTFGTPLRKYWSFTTAVGGGPAISDTISLVVIPANARILGGYVSAGSLGPAAAFNIGYPGALTRYANSLTVGMVSVAYNIASNVTTNFGEVLTKDQTIQRCVGVGR